MDWGMQNRLSSIIKPETGRTVMLAVDHGYFLGPTSGLEKPSEMLAPLLPYADTLMLTRGVLRNEVDPGTRVPIVLRVSGGSSVLKELSNEELTVAIEDAIRLNVAGVAISIFVGAEYEKQTLVNLTRLIDQAQVYGIPVLAVTAVGKEMGRDARFLALASRIAAELGATFVKTYFCEHFERVSGTCPVPCVIAGGKKVPEPEALKVAYAAVNAGAVGVDMGRNIFQSGKPVAMIQAVRAVVHQNLDPKKAFEMYRDLGGTVTKVKNPVRKAQIKMGGKKKI
jgi:putative autoinducer-2 (AI-2) aldolase